MGSSAVGVPQSAQMISNDTMAGAAERRKVARQFVTEVRVGAVVHLESTRLAVVVANAAPEAGGLKFSNLAGF
jgi:hypothetical protein